MRNTKRCPFKADRGRDLGVCVGEKLTLLALHSPHPFFDLFSLSGRSEVDIAMGKGPQRRSSGPGVRRSVTNLARKRKQFSPWHCGMLAEEDSRLKHDPSAPYFTFHGGESTLL